MTIRTSLDFRSALAAAAASISALLLSACASMGASSSAMPQAPKPPVTENVKLVQSLVLPVDTSVTLAQAWAQYGGCKPGTQGWEEVEPGRVQLSCSLDDGTIVQFDFSVHALTKRTRLEQFTYTAMNDAEFAGISLRGPDAEEALAHMYRNEPLF